jgi:N-carbamoyl-L-amino-acid hydrolase
VESSLHINPQRLQASIEAYAQIGATPGGGVTRLALTDADRAARDRLQAELEAIGCPVVVDDLGNMTGTLAGREDSPPVRIASHLDSVVRGGRFDGALGVLAGLEVLRTIRDARLAPRRSIALTNWTNEEGARFEPAMIGSGAALGEFDSAWMHDRRDPDGVRLGNELGWIGYLGEPQHRPTTGTACLELHIEQGPVLDVAEVPVGIVEGIVGITWIDVTVTGESAHAGPTPMGSRHDALAAAAELVTAAIDLGRQGGPPRAATVGRLDVSPNVINTIPSVVRLSVDFRASDLTELDAMVEALRDAANRIAAAKGVAIAVDRFWTSTPVSFDPSVIAQITRACGHLKVEPLRLWSGAGHDSRYTANVMPTGMIFVRSRGGVSHCEAEYSDPDDIALGANLLLQTALALAT